MVPVRLDAQSIAQVRALHGEGTITRAEARQLLGLPPSCANTTQLREVIEQIRQDLRRVIAEAERRHGQR